MVRSLLSVGAIRNRTRRRGCCDLSGIAPARYSAMREPAPNERFDARQFSVASCHLLPISFTNPVAHFAYVIKPAVGACSPSSAQRVLRVEAMLFCLVPS